MASLKERAYGLLRASERYTKTDMVYLAHGGFWLGLGQACTALTTFAFSVVVAWYVAPEEYGSYKYLLSFGLVVGALSLTGLSTSIVQSVARGYEGIFRTGFGRSLAWSWPVCAVLLTAAAYYFWRGNGEFGLACALMGAALPFLNAGSLYGPYLNGKKLFREGSLLWCAGNIISVGAIIGAAMAWGSALAMIAAYFVSNAAFNAAAYFLTLRKHRPNAEEDEESRSYDVHVSAVNLMATVGNHIDKLIVFQVLGPVQLAIYAFATAIPDQLRGFLKSGSLMALPKFAERPLEDIQKTLGGRLLRFALLICAAALGYALIAPYFFALVFPAYEAAVPYSQVLALSLFTVLASVPVSALQAHRKTRSLYAYTILNTVGQTVLTLVCVFLLGLWGAVLANISTRALSIALSYALFSRAR